MPITQTRMLCLLSAARSAEDALDKVRRAVHEAADRALRRPEGAAEEFALLDAFTDALARLPPEHVRTIATEFAHFRALARQNNSARLRQERKRREAGVKPMQPTHITQAEARLFARPMEAPKPVRILPNELDADARAAIDREVDAAVATAGKTPDEIAQDFFTEFEATVTRTEDEDDEPETDAPPL